MFYTEDFDANNIRFGDILTNQISIVPLMRKGHDDRDILAEKNDPNYTIEIKISNYFAVLTPCCSISKPCYIGNDALILAPLISLKRTFYSNPYLTEDFTRINRPMTAQETMPPEGWDALKPEDRAKYEREGKSFQFLNFFVYEGHPSLLDYEIKNGGTTTLTNYYMIDFKHKYSIIIPKKNQLKFKLLQLSVEKRSELREKMAYYYRRIPEEDVGLLD